MRMMSGQTRTAYAMLKQVPDITPDNSVPFANSPSLASRLRQTSSGRGQALAKGRMLAQPLQKGKASASANAFVGKILAEIISV